MKGYFIMYTMQNDMSFLSFPPLPGQIYVAEKLNPALWEVLKKPNRCEQCDIVFLFLNHTKIQRKQISKKMQCLLLKVCITGFVVTMYLH